MVIADLAQEGRTLARPCETSGRYCWCSIGLRSGRRRENAPWMLKYAFSYVSTYRRNEITGDFRNKINNKNVL